MGRKPKATTWIVTASGERPIAQLATDLQKAGFEIGRVLEAVGCITGSATKATAAKLRLVRGVADVAADKPIHIGPPDSDETW